jgi:hypothetical protein
MELIMSGCFGNSAEDQHRERELNRYLDSCEPWSDEDMRKAKDELYDDITWNGAAWDENLVSYRLDMFRDWESVMCSRLSSAEKIAEMNDIQSKYVKLYCNDEVEQDPDAYCEKYCSQFENEE